MSRLACGCKARTTSLAPAARDGPKKQDGDLGKPLFHVRRPSRNIPSAALPTAAAERWLKLGQPRDMGPHSEDVQRVFFFFSGRTCTQILTVRGADGRPIGPHTQQAARIGRRSRIPPGRS